MTDAGTDLVIKLYFSGNVNNDQLIQSYKWISDFIHAREINRKVNIEYYSVAEEKRRRVQFFSRKEKELQLMLPELKFSYIEIYKLDDIEHAFHAFDLSFHFKLSQPLNISLPGPPDNDADGHICFGMNYEYWKGMINENFIEQVITELSSIINKGKTKIAYGIVAKMPRTKNPYFYISGIGNFSLTKDETSSVDLFSKRKIKANLWEPFWGNIITQEHLRSNNHFKELVELLGEKNVIRMNGGLIFFKMPASINEFEYGSTLHTKYKKEIHKLFLKYDAVITE